MTRRQAARAIGISPSALAYLEQVKGLIRSQAMHVEVAPNVIAIRRMYDPAAVRELARTYVPQRAGRKAGDPSKDGWTASRAFAMFDKGRDWQEVVVALQISPVEACELHRLFTASAEQVLRQQAANEALEDSLRREQREEQRRHQKELAAIRARRPVTIIQRAVVASDAELTRRPATPDPSSDG